MNIKGLNKAAVLAALYNRAKPQGMGFLHYDPTPMTVGEAEDILEKMPHVACYFDYLKGRVMKVDLTSDEELDTRLYNRDNGEGTAEMAVGALYAGNVHLPMRPSRPEPRAFAGPPTITVFPAGPGKTVIVKADEAHEEETSSKQALFFDEFLPRPRASTVKATFLAMDRQQMTPAEQRYLLMERGEAHRKAEDTNRRVKEAIQARAEHVAAIAIRADSSLNFQELVEAERADLEAQAQEGGLSCDIFVGREEDGSYIAGYVDPVEAANRAEQKAFDALENGPKEELEEST